MNIYVANLSYQAMDSDLKKLFGEFGVVKAARVVMDNFTRRSRGFGFVDMEERTDGEKAISKLDKSSFMQQSLIVREASIQQSKRKI